MNWRVFARIGLALLFLGIVAAVAVGAYNLGMTQGLLQSEKLVITAPPIDPYGVRPYYFGGHPFGWGFGFLKCLVPLLIVFLLFGLVRGLAWRKWAWRHGSHHGPSGPHMHGPWGEHVRNTFNEWHQQAHQAETQAPPPATPQ